ncbi:MAG: Panacea domain-containing protein [Candidatus Acidiferrales bacterium]
MITFDFKPEKFVNAVALLATQCNSATKKKICKLLFYADKEHLLKYGRTITGDTYYRLPHGPIPTKGLDLLRGKGSEGDLALAAEYICVVGMVVRAKQPPNLKVFSRSDIEMLEIVCRLYGALSAEQLEQISHDDPAWKKTDKNQRIDFALFFEGLREGSVLKKITEAEAEEGVLLSRYRAG